MTLYHQPHNFMVEAPHRHCVEQNASDMFRRVANLTLKAYMETEEETMTVRVTDESGSYVPYFDVIYRRVNRASDTFPMMRNPEFVPMDTWYTLRTALWYMERTSDINGVRQTWTDRSGLEGMFRVFFGLLTEGLNHSHTADETFTFGDMAMPEIGIGGELRPYAFVPRMTLTIRYREESGEMRKEDYRNMMRDMGRTVENLV